MRRILSIMTLLALAIVPAHAQYKQPQQQPQPQPRPAQPPSGSLSVPQASTAPQQSIASVRRITRQEAEKLVKADKAIYVDVRSKEQYDFGHIKGAVSIPGSQIVTRLRELPPGKMIITYCACSAEQSSGRAVIELNNHGVKNTAALLGGWDEWKAAKLPVEMTKR